jgi:hypothetical protein
MNKDNLVICKEGFETETEKFVNGKVYRCFSLGEGDDKELLVYGVVFDVEHFNKHFKYTHDVIIQEWEKLGLIVNSKPISKTGFKELLDCHKYGRGRGSFYSGYIGHPKECCYQFNTNYSEPKTTFINGAYANFLQVCNGDMYSVDNKMICRGNSGYPISFANIYWR